MTPDDLEERRLLVIDNLDEIKAALACPDCAAVVTVHVNEQGQIDADIRHSMPTCPAGVDSGRWRRWHGYEPPEVSDGTQA